MTTLRQFETTQTGIPASQARVLTAASQPTTDAPMEFPIIALAPSVTVEALVGPKRWGVGHTVTFAKKGEANDEGPNYSQYITSIEISEEVDKDIEATITLDNAGFELSNDPLLSTGGVVVTIEISDGYASRKWRGLLTTDPTRSYSAQSEIKIVCRSRQIKLQLNEQAQKWEKKRDSEVVMDIARANGLKAVVEPTIRVRDVIIRGTEPVATFLNKLARRNGYEWRVDEGNLIFRKVSADPSNVTLTYRPNTGVGTILTASVTRKEDSQGGDGVSAKVPATDFGKGTVDSDTLADAQSNNTVNGRATTNVVGGTQTGPNRDIRKEALKDPGKEVYKLNPVTGEWEPFREKVSVKSKDVAGDADDGRELAKNLNETNAYNITLSMETWGLAQLRLSQIVNVVGLDEQDDGKWLISAMRTRYSAGDSWRMSLTTKAAGSDKPRGSGGAASVKVTEEKPVENKTENTETLFALDGAPGVWNQVETPK